MQRIKNNWPAQWQIYEFDELATRMSERVKPQESRKNYPCIELTHINQDIGTINGYTNSKEQKSTKNKFNTNQILFGKLRPYLRKFWKAEFEGVCSSEIWVFEGSELCLNEYLFYVIQTHRFNQIANVSSGTKMPRADWNFISDYPFAIPEIGEQKAIIDVISVWDNTISTIKQLIQAKKRYKKGLMQQLLAGEKRFSEFEGEGWIEVKIGDILKEIEREVDWDDSELYDLISVKRRSEGIIHREPLYGREIKTKNLKTVREDDFIISRMQVLHGASALATKEFDGTKVSGSYHTLVVRHPEKFSVKYFNYLSQTTYLYHLAYVSSHGVHIEKMTFKIDDYLKKEIKIPPSLEEQNRIVEVLEITNEEISLLQEKLAAIKKQKKGLMQQLLTGKVRVNGKLQKESV
jgi:type I restriction enzyme S subunit